MSLKDKYSNKRQGKRVWMTKKDLIAKFGEEPAIDIIERKLGDKELSETEVRDHPECPKNKDGYVSKLYTEAAYMHVGLKYQMAYPKKYYMRYRDISYREVSKEEGRPCFTVMHFKVNGYMSWSLLHVNRRSYNNSFASTLRSKQTPRKLS